ncbi:SDR family NAD(P)-dependent oxidoreductase [Gordonia oryzae]|uniref:SDR family NAD(P)-dependent oxidoreductase n=1 Tax=Gordonia oryzae TaxID=2487349 RepID=A0A3N4GZQ2_9ACTN|nr:type I polyketide synthase [Gordonia oryzae]RPA66288.1 SDR family NAD(P)-dependent oxidoreductase [Gordonia oryzae]
MKTTFDRVSAMTPAQRSALVEQFDKAARITGAEPIAVTGIGCRFPGGVRGPESFWELLTQGRDGVVEVPSQRWNAEEYYDPDPMVPGRMPSKWGGFLEDIAGFDADYFGITPREAEAMDPQQRIALEVAVEALEDAGYRSDALTGVRAAVTLGVYYNEYQSTSASHPESIDAYSATGNAHSITVGRIAYLLGLRGPAVAVDTACSSSLVALHLACQSLRSRESDLGLAGGVSVILRPETQLALGKWGMLSPRGRCNAFDVAADGFVRGEGAGVVVLKRLADAVRDGDRVHAVIRGSAVNSDGRSNGLTAPNAPAQREVITRALAAGDVPASSVNFVETHGTGTSLGDPIEFDALSAVYGRESSCALGAVKTNFGHLEAAAGIAGFIKAVLTVEHGLIPPNLHFTQWNPAIDARPTSIVVPIETMQWPQTDTPRRAGVSSFGLGGTNAHIVIEQGPGFAASSGAPATPTVSRLSVTGRSEHRVRDRARALAQWLEAGRSVALTDVAATLDRLRTNTDPVGTVCARDTDEALAGLRALADGSPRPGVLAPRRYPTRAGTVFVFSGQGSQWAGMGRRLLVAEPAFAAAVAELEPVFVAVVGFSLREVLASGEPVVGIDRIQPVLVGVQLALVSLWRSYGVCPDAVIGHSMGEVAAAVVSGALSVADGLSVIATRSRLMKTLSGHGAMALLEADAATADALVRAHPGLSTAVYASPRQCVVAGAPEQIDAAIAEVTARNLLARRVEVDVASHHRTVDPILDDLRAALADLTPQRPTIPMVSTVEDAQTAPVTDADYWVRNLRNPVRFGEAITLASEDYSTFIEISPHPLLTHSIHDTLAAARPGGDVEVLGTLVRDDDETLTFHGALAVVESITAEPGPGKSGTTDPAVMPPPPVTLAPTSWQHTRYWPTVRATPLRSGEHPLLGTHVEVPGGEHIWQGDIGTDRLAWLGDHQVHDRAVLPAAGFAEMVLAAAAEALGASGTGLEVHRLEVEEMLAVDTAVAVTTRLCRAADGEVRVEIHSRTTEGAWRKHATGRVVTSTSAEIPAPVALIGGTTVAPSDFYYALRRTGAAHGEAFAALTHILRMGSTDDAGRRSGASESRIELPAAAGVHRGFRLHPVLLDAALQGVAAAMPTESTSVTAAAGADAATYLPVAIDSLRVTGVIGRRATCSARVTEIPGTADKLGSFILSDESGAAVAVASGIYLRRVERHSVPLPLEQKLFDTEWVPADLPSDASGQLADGSWLILTGLSSTSESSADDLADVLGRSPSRRVIRAMPAGTTGSGTTGSGAAHTEAAIADLHADSAAPAAGVVVMLDTETFDPCGAASEQSRELVWSVTSAIRAVAARPGHAPRVWLVTRNGIGVGADESGSPTVGALEGLVRVMTYEHPTLRVTLVDLDGDENAALVAELAADSRDDVVAWRAGARHVRRLRRASLAAPSVTPVAAGAAYIVTGGLGGLGTLMARHLLDAGAGRVVLNGRRAITPDQQTLIDDLSHRGEVTYIAGDIAEPGVAAALVDAAGETGRVVRGVLHAAAVIDDALLSALTPDSLSRVWAPKVAGAIALHEATTHLRLDWWVVFSSAASLLGSPGQGAYAAANAWADAFALWRRHQGLPATAINWGQWAEVGVAAALTMDALDPISPAEGIEAFDALVAADATRAGVIRLRLDRAAVAFPELDHVGYFGPLVAELHALSDDTWGGVEALRDLDATTTLEAVTDRVRTRIAAIMGFADSRAVDVDKPLTDLGMDSLMAVRIRNAVRGDFGAEPPVALLLQGASLRALAADLIRQLDLAVADDTDASGGLRERAQLRAAARQRAGRRRTGQRA